jgi:hypothetical protein
MHQGTCNRITKGRNNSSLPIGLQKYSYQQPNPSQPAYQHEVGFLELRT